MKTHGVQVLFNLMKRFHFKRLWYTHFATKVNAHSLQLYSQAANTAFQRQDISVAVQPSLNICIWDEGLNKSVTWFGIIAALDWNNNVSIVDFYFLFSWNDFIKWLLWIYHGWKKCSFSSWKLHNFLLRWGGLYSVCVENVLKIFQCLIGVVWHHFTFLQKDGDNLLKLSKFQGVFLVQYWSSVMMQATCSPAWRRRPHAEIP